MSYLVQITAKSCWRATAWPSRVLRSGHSRNRE